MGFVLATLRLSHMNVKSGKLTGSGAPFALFRRVAGRRVFSGCSVGELSWPLPHPKSAGPHAVASARSRDRGRRRSSVDEISTALAIADDRSKHLSVAVSPIVLATSGPCSREDQWRCPACPSWPSNSAAQFAQPRGGYPFAIGGRYDRRDGRRRIKITDSSIGTRDRQGQGPSPHLPRKFTRATAENGRR